MSNGISRSRHSIVTEIGNCGLSFVMSRFLILLVGALSTVNAFNVVARVPASLSTRTTTPVLAAATDADKAAAKVKAAAAKFGKVQSDAAKAWVDSVMASDEGCPTEDLLSSQLILFEECTLDDEGGKCKELDGALSAFEEALSVKLPADATKAKALLEKSKKDRAAARVRAAAAKFGGAQKTFAETWTRSAVAAGASSGSLMEQTLELFDSCQVTADGKADPKCVALFDALDNLQVALIGEVKAPSSEAVVGGGAAKAGAAGSGQGGQFKPAATSNNGCWPYNK